jgi:hypothetical protein
MPEMWAMSASLSKYLHFLSTGSNGDALIATYKTAGNFLICFCLSAALVRIVLCRWLGCVCKATSAVALGAA